MASAAPTAADARLQNVLPLVARLSADTRQRTAQDRLRSSFSMTGGPGVANPAKSWVGMPYTAEYVADEAAMLVAARAMAAVTLARLGGR